MNKVDKHLVLSVGEVLWDILPDGVKMLGGAPANFAYHVARCGCESRLVSAVGGDVLGCELLARLTEKGLGDMISVAKQATGHVNVALDENGIPQYDIVENVAWDNIPLTERLLAVLPQASAVCFGTLAQRDEISRDTIRQIVETMGGGALRVFDVNLRQHYYSTDVIKWSLCHCDILKLNDDELSVFRQMFALEGDATECCRQLLTHYSISQVILTMGQKGSMVVTNRESNYIPAQEVAVVDTIGAGDAFTAAYVAAILNGKSFVEAQHEATAVAGSVCAKAGAMPDIE